MLSVLLVDPGGLLGLTRSANMLRFSGKSIAHSYALWDMKQEHVCVLMCA